MFIVCVLCDLNQLLSLVHNQYFNFIDVVLLHENYVYLFENDLIT